MRIDLEPNQPQARPSRLRFSVETTVHTGLEDVAGERANAARGVAARRA